MRKQVLPPKRRDVPADELALFDEIGTRAFGPDFVQLSDSDDWVPAAGYFGALLHWPIYFVNRFPLSRIVRFDGSYSYKDREFISIVLHRHMNTNCVMSGHLDDAIASGVRLEAIAAIRAGADGDLTDDERILAQYIRAVVDGTVSDEIAAPVEKRMGVQALAQYAVCITVIAMSMRQTQAFGIPEWSDEQIDTMIAEYQDGTRKVDPNWVEH
jgi:alkylhydroperoxidase family enzyme